MSMLEERIKRSAKKSPAAPPKQERVQKEQPTNPNGTFLRKPAQEEVPNKLRYVQSYSWVQAQLYLFYFYCLYFYLTVKRCLVSFYPPLRFFSLLPTVDRIMYRTYRM